MSDSSEDWQEHPYFVNARRQSDARKRMEGGDFEGAIADFTSLIDDLRARDLSPNELSQLAFTLELRAKAFEQLFDGDRESAGVLSAQFSEALAAWLVTPDSLYGRAACHDGMGRADLLGKSFETALRHFTESIEIYGSIQDSKMLAEASFQYARAAIGMAAGPLAREALDRAIDGFEENKQLDRAAEAYLLLGQVYIWSAGSPEAVDTFEEGVDAAESAGAIVLASEGLRTLTGLIADSDVERALGYARRRVRILSSPSSPAEEHIAALAVLATLHAQRSELEVAQRCIADADARAAELGGDSPSLLARFLLEVARDESDIRGNHEALVRAANDFLQRGETEFRLTGEPVKGLPEVCIALSSVRKRAGDFAGAEAALLAALEAFGDGPDHASARGAVWESIGVMRAMQKKPGAQAKAVFAAARELRLANSRVQLWRFGPTRR